MPVKSLQKLALQCAIENVKQLEDYGDVPYQFIRLVLARVVNPHHLHRIEVNSPQIVGEDEELWRAFIRRDITHGDKWLSDRDQRIRAEDFEAEKSGDPEPQRKIPDWYKIYEKLQRQNKRSDAENNAALKKVMDDKAEQKMKNVTTFWNKGNLPTDIKPSQLNIYSFKDQRPQKPKTGSSILQKARKETQKAVNNRRVINTPLGMVKQVPGQTVFQNNQRPAPSVPASASSPSQAQSREEAQQRRERALAQNTPSPSMGTHIKPRPQSRPTAGSPLLPHKRRRV